MTLPYRHQRLTFAQARAIAKALDAGVPARVLAREYGVDPRSVYRAAQRADEPSAVIDVGAWRTTFLLTDEGPVQVEPWVPAT